MRMSWDPWKQCPVTSPLAPPRNNVSGLSASICSESSNLTQPYLGPLSFSMTTFR